jgi:hypothetical protein
METAIIVNPHHAPASALFPPRGQRGAGKWHRLLNRHKKEVGACWTGSTWLIRHGELVSPTEAAAAGYTYESIAAPTQKDFV